MPVPWLRILDALIGVTDLARSRRIGRMSQAADADPQQQLETRGGGIETRLAGVVVAALKEAFERDTRRLDLERAQLDAERERAERALRLELRRQAGDREIGRLRLLAGVAIASWIGTLFFAARLLGAGVRARAALGSGWLLLLIAFACAVIAQTRVGQSHDRSETAPLESGVEGTLAVWLIVGGLGLVGVGVLLL